MAQAQLLPLDVELPLDLRLPRIGSVDAVALEARAGELAKRSIKKGVEARRARPRDPDDGPDDARGRGHAGQGRALCARRRCTRIPADPSIPSVAAVCVYPNLVAVAKTRLAGSTVKVASVATAFPSGQSPIEVKLADVREAVALGADEIDMVIDRGAFLSGRYAKVVDEIVRVKEACGAAHLKVILETGELGTYDNVRRASLLAIAAGADFIKTSTGKVSPAATLPVTLCMLEVIRDVHDETGRIVGMKPAGGIRTAKQAIQYLCVLNETLGTAWMTPDLFRFGASSLLNDVLMQIRKQRTGRLPVRRLLHDRLRWRAKTPATRAVPSPLEWEYAPAPEARDIVSLEERYGLYIGGEQVAPRSRKWFATISPSTEEHLAEVALAGARDVDLAVQAARGAFEDGWSSLRPAERAKYLFRIARLIQERSRELAVAESLDGGKPIKESRDVDIPLAAAHFFYYAGWADKLEYAFPNRTPAPARRRRPDHPLELPAADARLEDRAGARLRQHGRAQAGRDDAADRADLHRHLPPGRAAGGRRQHHHGRRLHRRASRQAPRPRQGRVHRLDRGRQGDPARARGHRHQADARARRQGRQHRLRRLRARPGGRGDRQRDLLQPGPRLLRRARACSCRSRSTSRSSPS